MRFHSSTQLHTKRTKMLDDHLDVSWERPSCSARLMLSCACSASVVESFSSCANRTHEVVLFADAAAEPLPGQQPLNCSGHTGKPAPLLLSASWDGSVRECVPTYVACHERASRMLTVTVPPSRVFAAGFSVFEVESIS